MCFQLEAEIKSYIGQGRQAMWELARAMYEFNEESGWTALNYENQSEWLAQPEIGMTRTQFFRLVRKYRELVVRRELPAESLVELEPSKVDIVLPAIEEGRVTVEEALEDAKSMGARDLREHYNGLAPVRDKKPKGGADDDDDDDDDVIDGTAHEVDPDAQPETASRVKDKETAERNKERDTMMHSAGMVSSWFELGGDRRKAKRNWPKVRELHPFFRAMQTVEDYLEGGDTAPEKLDAARAWVLVENTLGLEDATAAD